MRICLKSCGDWGRAKNFPGCIRAGTKKSRAPSGVLRVSMGVSTSTNASSSRCWRMMAFMWERSRKTLVMSGRLRSR